MNHNSQPDIPVAEKMHAFADTDKAWEKLHHRLQNEGLIPVTQPHVRRMPVPVWTRWAATLLVLITSGVFIFTALNKNPKQQYVVLSNANDNSTYVHMLDDGTVVYLADNTTLKVPENYGETNRTVILEGEAFFDIEHDPSRPFIVEAMQVNIQVLGTAFNVRATDPDTFELFVERGLVRASLKQIKTASIEAGQGELIRAANNTLSKSPDNTYAKSAWKINRMHFKDEPLQNVLTVINRNYNAHVFLQYPELSDRKMTVTFYNNNLSTIIELICLSMNMEAEFNSSSDIMLKPNI